MEVHVIGEVIGGKRFGRGSLMCRWTMVYGDGWSVLEGVTEGQTQVDDPWIAAGDSADSFDAVWEHPIDVHFRSSSLAGWPMIRFHVWHHDSNGRNEPLGHGAVRVPTCPGIYDDIGCSTWRPKGGVIDEATTFFLGGAPRVVDERTVTSTDDRRGFKTVSSGTVLLRLSILLKDAERHGLSF